MWSICLPVSFCLVFVSFVTACSSGGSSATGGKTFPIIEQKCGTCHSAKSVYAKKRTEDDWKRVLHGMKMRGLKVTPDEEREIMNVLTEHLLLEN